MASPVESGHKSALSDRRSSDWTIDAADRPLFEADVESGKSEETQDWFSGTAGGRFSQQIHRVKSILLSSNRVTRQARNRYVVLFVLALTFIAVSFHTHAPSRLRAQISKAASPPKDQELSSMDRAFGINESQNGLWPEILAPGQPVKLCDICDCTVSPGFYNPKPSATQYLRRPGPSDLRPAEGVINYNNYLRQSILDLYCTRQHMSTSQTTRLVRRTSRHFEQMASWNVTGLELGKPTIYFTTSSSPNDKTEDKRPQYFRRHARQMKRWLDAQAQQAEAAGNSTTEWQILWVVVEDELDIDPEIVRTIQRIGIPYIYFAYGPTNSLANAQKNANLQMVHALTRSETQGGLYGHGPVYGLDDDNKFLPELIDMLVSVENLGVFPVGNFGGSDGYEKPILNYIGEIIGSESPWYTRKYPFDYGGYVFNSSLLGTQISGPMFWKHTAYAGESEFIDQVVDDIRQLEPLCGPQLVQDCHVVWHNEPLTDIEELTDEGETAFMNSYGVDVWESRLRDQEAEREEDRGY